MNPEAKTWIDRGSNLFDKRRFEEAIDCYEKAFEKDEENALHWFHKWLDEGKLRRISEAVDSEIQKQTVIALHIAESFRYYPKTSFVMIRLAAILTKRREIAGFEEFGRKLDLIYNTFRIEFVEASGLNRDYTRKCFSEISAMLANSIKNLGGKEIEELFPDLLLLHSKCLEIDNKLRPSTDLMTNLLTKAKRSTEESILSFNLFCSTYLEGVEALFNDVIKMLYLFSQASMGNILRFEQVETFSIWDIRKAYKQLLRISPVFLEPARLEKIIHIRNAIAHAQTQFNPETGRVRFQSIDKFGKVVFDKTMNFEAFIEVYFEVLTS